MASAKTTMMHSRLQICMLIAGYFVYLLMGAFVFQALERDAEVKEQDKFFRMKEDFLKNFTSHSPAEVEVFVENLMEAIRMGIDPKAKTLPNGHSSWDFGNSFLFVGSTLSTIGYGYVSPKTAGGQLFCVFFALFGIPLNIVFLHHIGKVLSLLCERLAKCVHRKEIKTKRTRLLTLLFFLVMGILVFLCVPSAIFQEMEGWTYSEAIYFTFITLSTIGFGDYVIGRKHGRNYFPGYRIMAAIWIIFGLAWIALLFNLLTTLLEDPEKKPIQELIQVKTGLRQKAKLKTMPIHQIST
ncbi:potassium channel subfamily K member 16-like isoform X2 [Hemicordylus capensis]|uniref:potassium channel subfamily K member 16-like isoform X2 n=2 Tax=Hemicordylus capensis TaxID=884348 RepID=UPI0023048744|nr:potassium channel subfamily K member 16-like isoform X2 [Hemicordylus capensis]